MELGAAVTVKSGTGAAEIETAAVVVWAVEFSVPVTVTIVDDAGAAESEAVSMNWPSCPGVRESAEGDAVTPMGRPVSATTTEPALPLVPATVTVRARAEPPLCRATVAGAAAIVKSGRRAGPDDVPQPRANVSAASNARRGVLIKFRVLWAKGLIFWGGLPEPTRSSGCEKIRLWAARYISYLTARKTW
jgi:hypothetical protein